MYLITLTVLSTKRYIYRFVGYLNQYVKIIILYLDEKIILTKHVPLVPESNRYKLSFIHAYQLPAFEICIIISLLLFCQILQ